MESLTRDAGFSPKQVEPRILKRRARWRKWAAKNQERLIAYRKLYWQANKAKMGIQFRAWRLKNRERRLAYARNWSKTHRKSVSASYRKWAAKSYDHLRRWQIQYAKKNRKRIRAYMDKYSKEYYKKNKAKIIAQTKAYAKTHPEVTRKSRLNWQKNHPDKYRAHNAVGNLARRAREASADVGDKQINGLIRQWKRAADFVCEYCTVVMPTTRLHVDHKVPLARGGKHEVGNICRACDKCNLRKRNKTSDEFMALRKSIDTSSVL